MLRAVFDGARGFDAVELPAITVVGKSRADAGAAAARARATPARSLHSPQTGSRRGVRRAALVTCEARLARGKRPARCRRAARRSYFWNTRGGLIAKMKSIALLLCLGAARAADLDGDGVTDVAAAGTCCAYTYGNALSDCGGATDLAGPRAAARPAFGSAFPSRRTGQSPPTATTASRSFPRPTAPRTRGAA